MRLIASFLVSCVIFAGGAQAATFSLPHSDGVISLPSTPEKIVAYDLAVIDSLHTLGVPVQGVPQPAELYTGALAALQKATKVGTLFEPDYERLQMLKPDLIFAGARSQGEVDNLNELAPTAIMRLQEPYMEHFREHNLALGKAFNKQREAKQAVRAVEKNVARLSKRNKGKTGAFLFVVNDRVIAHAPGERFGFAYEISGLTSVLPPKDPASIPAVRPAPNSPEALQMQQVNEDALRRIVDAEPDWLLVLDRGALNNGPETAADTLAQHATLSNTEAFKEGRVYYVSINDWYVVSGGLTTLKTITEDMLANM